jgi:hypothetical protein
MGQKEATDVIRRASLAVSEARAEWGKGWEHLSEHQQQAEVALRVCAMLSANSEPGNPLEQAGAIAFAAIDMVNSTNGRRNKTDARFLSKPT